MGRFLGRARGSGRRGFRSAVGSLFLGSLPAIAWTAFSTFYYGFPWPNPAYAKLGTGIALPDLLAQGGHYFLDSLDRDPVTLPVILLAFLLGVRGRDALNRSLAWGMFSYLAFTLEIGGDFMSGRFFSVPLFAAMMLLTRHATVDGRPALVLGTIVAVVGLSNPGATLHSGSDYRKDGEIRAGIADERGIYFPARGWLSGDRSRFPSTSWPRPSQDPGERKVVVTCGGLGFAGLAAGPFVHLVDRCGLADPLLARLPMIELPNWRPGHFRREVPDHYLESIQSAENLLTDPAQRELYDRLIVVTRGSLWSGQRLRAILELNFGIEGGPPDPPRSPPSSAMSDELLTILGDGRPRVEEAGRWNPLRTLHKESPGGLTEEEREELESLPYLQGYEPAPEKEGVVRYLPEKTYPGINLVNSGHAPFAFLMDAKGEVLHEWSYALDEVWPEVPQTIHSSFWRWVHLYPNGDLLAIFEGIGLLKLDRDSRLLWAYRGGCHHHLEVDPTGRIYVLTRRAQRLPDFHPSEPVLAEFVTVLSPQGEALKEVSILECFRGSAFRRLLDSVPKRNDVLHTNSVAVLSPEEQGLRPFFRGGDVMISIRKIDTLAVLDLDERTVLWANSGADRGTWDGQHDPSILPDGKILLFDNRAKLGRSRVLEYDPELDRITWEYAGDDDHVLYSPTCGTVDRLPNGNTLIVESDAGRAFEIDRDPRIVWDYYNPHRAGDRDELIATLFQVERLDPDELSWLEPEPGSGAR